MKIGDKVICKNSTSRNGYMNGEPKLAAYKVYTITEIPDIPIGYPTIIRIEGYYYIDFSINKFLTVSEYRKQKLLKLKNDNLV